MWAIIYKEWVSKVHRQYLQKCENDETERLYSMFYRTDTKVPLSSIHLSIHPFILFVHCLCPYIPIQGHNNLYPCVHLMEGREPTYTLTTIGNLQSPVHLTYIPLESERAPQQHIETDTNMSRKNPTQKKCRKNTIKYATHKTLFVSLATKQSCF